MATIDISDLCPVGYDLFSDSESYMTELDSGELNSISGGSTLLCMSIGATISVWVTGALKNTYI
jgi:hypothetical protein